MIQELAIILPVLWFAAVVQGSTGFGFGLVAVGVLTLFLPVQNAAVMNALPALTVNLALLWRLHPHLQWRDLRWIAPASVVATPFGVAGLRMLDSRMMYGLLAAVLAVSILQSMIGRPGSRPWHALWLGFPMGIFSGLLAGAYGTGGPPAVAYVQSHHYERHRHVVSIQLLLAITGSIRVVSLLSQNALTPRQWTLNGLGALAVLPGVWLGLRLLRWMPQVWLRRAILVLLTLTMIHCVVKSIRTPPPPAVREVPAARRAVAVFVRSRSSCSVTCVTSSALHPPRDGLLWPRLTSRHPSSVLADVAALAGGCRDLPG